MRKKPSFKDARMVKPQGKYNIPEVVEILDEISERINGLRITSDTISVSGNSWMGFKLGGGPFSLVYDLPEDAREYQPDFNPDEEEPTKKILSILPGNIITSFGSYHFKGKKNISFSRLSSSKWTTFAVVFTIKFKGSPAVATFTPKVQAEEDTTLFLKNPLLLTVYCGRGRIYKNNPSFSSYDVGNVNSRGVQ